jgi:hypothetical protein
MREKLNKMPLCLHVSIFFFTSIKQGPLKGKHGLAAMHAVQIPHVYALSYTYDIILGHRQLWKNFITFVVPLNCTKILTKNHTFSHAFTCIK